MCPSSGELFYQCDTWFMSLCIADGHLHRVRQVGYLQGSYQDARPTKRDILINFKWNKTKNRMQIKLYIDLQLTGSPHKLISSGLDNRWGGFHYDSLIEGPSLIFSEITLITHTKIHNIAFCLMWDDTFCEANVAQNLNYPKRVVIVFHVGLQRNKQNSCLHREVLILY